jgi:sulfonate transport system substrate-binding protein
MNDRAPGARASLAAILVSVLLLGLCGTSGASTLRVNASASQASTSQKIPPGTVLHVGEQLSNLKTILSLAGEDKNFPYQVQYSEFVGGPAMLQAFEGGALDLGFVQSTPLIFAQSAGQSLFAVAGWASTGSFYGLVSSPGHSSIRSWADLKGKTVAYQVGTALEAALLVGLKSAGLNLSDITSVNLPATQIAAALQGGSADVGIEVEPLLSAYLASNPTAHVITRPSAITDKAEFLVASSSALNSPAVSAAMADYISRLVKAYAYLRAHPQAVIQSVYIKQYGLTPARAAAVAKLVGPTSFFTLPGAILPQQQELANLFAATGAIPGRIDVAKEFNARFNTLITSVQGQ